MAACRKAAMARNGPLRRHSAAGGGKSRSMTAVFIPEFYRDRETRGAGGCDSGKGAGGKTVAAGGVNAGDPQWREQVFPLQIGDDAGDGFEAQVGDVGDVLPGGQDDLSAAVRQETDQAEDAG